MSKNEGTIMLQKCMNELTSEKKDVKQYIAYKYGTRVDAQQYQTDKIEAFVNYSNESPTALFCVKYFCHLGIFAAWEKRGDYNKQKYFVYKAALVDMQNGKIGNFCEIPIDLNNVENIFLFRDEEGAKEFVQQKLLPKIASITAKINDKGEQP